jgi:hypothetical protein
MAIDSRTVSYSIIVPVFNEEAVLPILLRRLDLLLTRLNGPRRSLSSTMAAAIPAPSCWKHSSNAIRAIA